MVSHSQLVYMSFSRFISTAMSIEVFSIRIKTLISPIRKQYIFNIVKKIYRRFVTDSYESFANVRNDAFLFDILLRIFHSSSSKKKNAYYLVDIDRTTIRLFKNTLFFFKHTICSKLLIYDL